ncbi:hypothetical protein JOC78_003190 [Bacillus ectoiniformans]|uniref:arylamine N-acetyltransferase n=1 Tax=Bacillus ectoiniformans TaxID=1494429 RepID=UPI001957A312|nr:arylamine N-acetyltransferase [Bacillus ectoiniformans]MBM7650206.1 hypothetical protein [Bacillus ectoiniformans]
MDEVSRYLHRLKIKQEEPTLNYLQRLIQHHLSLIPYETFSKFHYYIEDKKDVPDFSEFIANLEQRGWGGTCYSLNINFARLLEKLGYACQMVRVTPGHAAIMVTVGDRNYYVDVGYGSPIIRPIELASKQRHVLHGFGEEIIFTRINEHHYLLERRSNGKTFVTKQITWLPLTEEELEEDVSASYKDEEDNVTMRRISAVRFYGNECYFLRDDVLKVMNYRDIREYRYRNKEQWMQAVAQAFHVDEISMKESLDFLDQRGISLFKKLRDE